MVCGRYPVERIVALRHVRYHGPPRLVEVRPNGKMRVGTLLRAVVRDGDIGVCHGLNIGRREVAAVGEELGAAVVPLALPQSKMPEMVTRVAVRGLPAVNAGWHHDQSFMERPPDWSLLYCDEAAVHAEGTAFSDGAALLSFISDPFLEVVRSVSVRHAAYYPTDDSTVSPDVASAIHPLVVGVEGGVDSLFAAPATARGVVGWSVAESDMLLNYLFEKLNWPELCVVHKWKAGDLVAWPNRRYVHRALPLEAEGTRSMLRIVGHWKNGA